MLYILAFLVAILSVHWIHPRLVRIALDKNIVDNPNARKLQRRPTPVLGGIAVFFGSVIGLGCASITCDCSELFIVVVAMMIMLYTGTMDDILDLSPALRFLIEIGTVLLLIFVGGYTLNDFHGLWGLNQIPQGVAIPLTVFAAVGIINAINLIDGVDGLSSGYCILTSLLFGMMFWYVGDLLEVLEVLRRRVVAAAAVGLQVELELLDEAAVDLVQIEVVAVVGVAHELLRELHAGLVALGGGSGQIDAHQLVAFVVVLAEELEERVAVRGLAAEVEVQYLLGCEGLLVHLQVAVDADDAGPHGVDVEVDGLAERGAGRGLAADGVPLIGEDTLADGGVGALAVDRDADAHGDLPVLVGSRPTHVERDPKSTFLSIHILHVLTGCKFTPPCAILEYAKRS